MMEMGALKKKKIGIEIIKDKIKKESIILFAIGVFLARANILGGLTPFGFSYLAAYMIIKGISLPVFLSVTVGTILFHGFSGFGYLLSYGLSLGFFVFNKKEDISLIKAILITTSMFMVSKFLSLSITSESFFLYDYLMALFEGVVVFSMTYIFSFSPPIESLKNIDVKSEKAICSFIVLALAIGGISNFSILGVSLKTIVSLVIILYLSYVKGSFYGGTIGIIMGMITYMAEPNMPFIIGVFAVSGLLGGIFKELGKVGSILGFVLGSGIVTFYINGLGSSLFQYKEIAISIIIFLVIPKKFNDKLLDSLNGSFEYKKDYMKRKEEIVLNKLRRMSIVFENLSETFKEASKDQEINSTVEIYSLVDCVANQVCKDCVKYDECWKANYYSTYNSFFKLVSLREINDSNESIANEEIEKFCIASKDIQDNINHAIEKLKLNESWKNKLNENKVLLSEQLKGFSATIDRTIENLYEETTFIEEIEQKTYQELKNNRIDVYDVSVIQTSSEDIEVYINLNTKYDIDEKLKKIVSLILGFPVLKDPVFKSENGESHKFKLVRNNRFSAMTSSVTDSNSENKISGDSFTFGDVDNIHYTALSDGMGIGRKAKEESRVAISLLENLMEANMEKEVIINTINSVLITKSDEEIFTTLDFGFIDLYSGKFQMIKAGSPLTLIKRKDRIDVINSLTLPVGMLKDVNLNIYESYVEDGDIIIMVSDGITEANKDIVKAEEWIMDLVLNIDSINPEEIGKRILDNAKDICEGHRDDMTVLVTKVWKNI